MKKFFIIAILAFLTVNMADAKPAPPPKKHHHPPIHHHSGSCSPNCVYVVNSEVYQDERNFADCKDHFLYTETVVNYYSNGTKRTYNNYTILNSDGSILASDCTMANHVIYNNKHYILFKKNGTAQIMDGYGNIITKRQYSYLNNLNKNRILAKSDKKYGIIDLEENILLPIKYKEIKEIGFELYITKLNGYYGLVNVNGDKILANEYDKIKKIQNSILTKKYGKFGLVDMNGKIVLEANCEKIKKLGEYILVKKDDKYGVYSADGKIIAPIEYKKIRLERNSLEGQKNNKTWEKI